MRARFNFASALFSKASMDRLAGYYLALLQQMARHDDWPLENIRLQPQSPARLRRRPLAMRLNAACNRISCGMRSAIRRPSR